MAEMNIDIEKKREEEKLRQIKLIFNQKKKQDSQWHSLRLVMGWFTVIMLATISFFFFYILMSEKDFKSLVETMALVALFVDILGLHISVWRFALNPKSISKLEPNI